MDVEISRLAENQAAVVAIIANPKRVLILWTLKDQEKTVSEIATAVGASMQNTSQHLRLMKDGGFLDSRREAQRIYYHVADNDLVEACFRLLQICQQEFE